MIHFQIQGNRLDRLASQTANLKTPPIGGWYQEHLAKCIPAACRIKLNAPLIVQCDFLQIPLSFQLGLDSD